MCAVLCGEDRPAEPCSGALLPPAADRVFRGAGLGAGDRVAGGRFAERAGVLAPGAAGVPAGPFDDLADAASIFSRGVIIKAVVSLMTLRVINNVAQAGLSKEPAHKGWRLLQGAQIGALVSGQTLGIDATTLEANLNGNKRAFLEGENRWLPELDRGMPLVRVRQNNQKMEKEHWSGIGANITKDTAILVQVPQQ